jgi:SM-20-related protein
MSMLNYAHFDAAPLQRDPYDYLVVPEFIKPEALDAINQDYPSLPGPGSHPIENTEYGAAFAEFWTEVTSPGFRARFAEKFGIDLEGSPVMATVREFCEESDGHIHTDSKTKIITVLFYFNKVWPHEGGRLRILRSADDLADYADEVVPERGTMLAFRRSGTSFHGHRPFVGERRIMQMHWVDAKRIARNERKRQSLKWRFKKALGLG